MIRLLPLLFALPAMASTPGLAALAAQVDAQGSAGLAAAYAACLAGQGDVERTAALFTAKGWERIDDDEIGMVELHADAAPYVVTVWIDAPRCDVTSSTLGTDAAQAALQAVVAQAGLPATPADPQAGCPAVTLGHAHLTIAASPQGGPCPAAASSAATILFEAS